MRDGKVLVHCTGGMGRAATLAVALLVRRGYTLPHAYRLVRDRRPQVAPSDAQLAALTEYARRLGRDAGVPTAGG
jgi:protein-tyrosine phosphatase